LITIEAPWRISQRWSIPTQLFWGAAFLVSVPVFFQAPLVRAAPWLALVGTVGWLSLARQWERRPWGSLVWGFGLAWLCGSLYWGWVRWEPLWHLPMEALALPWALWAIARSPAHRVGGWFYLGSLVGTAVTDLYFWVVGLGPLWRIIARTEGEGLSPLLQQALALVRTDWGLTWGLLLGWWLLWLTWQGWRAGTPHHRAFAGAVGSTLLVDGLFAVVAALG